jgi:ESCRT-I complex subunit TSG101
LAFVVPTSDMLVKSSKHVDVSGLCRMDYIINWEKKYEVRGLCHIAVALI